jgi:hypothetical protein
VVRVYNPLIFYGMMVIAVRAFFHRVTQTRFEVAHSKNYPFEANLFLRAQTDFRYPNLRKS